MTKNIISENQIVVFHDRKIRRIFHENEWFFSILDVVGVLSESNNPRRYWSDLKRQLNQQEDSFSCTKKSYN